MLSMVLRLMLGRVPMWFDEVVLLVQTLITPLPLIRSHRLFSPLNFEKIDEMGDLLSFILDE